MRGFGLEVGTCPNTVQVGRYVSREGLGQIRCISRDGPAQS